MFSGFTDFLPKNKHTEKLIKGVIPIAEKYIGTPISSLTYSRYSIYSKTGSRIEYEEDYIEHRKRLSVFAIMSLYEDNEIYIHELEDIIWAICDEYTWVLPAHEISVDLFAAETAFYLSEVIYLTRKRIDKNVYNRAVNEIKRRVIAPYLSSDLKWGKSNWSAVCAASIGAAMLYTEDFDAFEQKKTAILASLELFLDSYEEDGCCTEGSLYWQYGFGFFCYFASMLREYTNGEIDYFKNKKVERIAMFGQHMFIEKNNCITFSDAPHEMFFEMGLYTFLSKEYADFYVPDEKYESVFGDDIRYRLCNTLRDYYWYDENLKTPKNVEKTVYLEKSMWFLNKNENYYFACKGGNNDEPHNHNDLGAFLLYDNGRYIIDDLGWPEYDRYYFTEKRYDYLCASSKGHSVPIADGNEQVAGEDIRAKVVSVGDKSISLDLSLAYKSTVIRTFECLKNGIKITDRLPENSVERFVTRIEPTIKNNTVFIDNWAIECDYPFKISKDCFNPRNSICKSSMKETETAFLIDFAVDKNTAEFIIRKV